MTARGGRRQDEELERREFELRTVRFLERDTNRRTMILEEGAYRVHTDAASP